METVYIRNIISGNIYKEIKYINFTNLANQLQELIIEHNCDILMELLINDDNLNNYDIININILSKLNKNLDISLIFSDKKKIILFI